jgi:acyl-CoA synthetase (AMP-forming)/AMP-acid ligase II/NADP-dependent 3-hydroxy acid dehydrogenase YdfG
VKSALMASAQRWEQSLLADDRVADCAVRARTGRDGAPLLVAYVAPRGSVSRDALLARLEPAASGAVEALPVLVSQLPRDAAGRIDEARLQEVPAVEEQAASRLEQLLRELPGVERAACVVAPRVFAPQRLHLADVAPAWAARRAQRRAAEQTPQGGPAAPELAGSGRPSLSEGGAVDSLPFASLPDMLREAARQSPEQGLVHLKDDGSETLESYPALLERARELAAGLRAAGLSPGERVLFQLPTSDAFFAAFWGCVLGGMIPVPVSMAARYDVANPSVEKLLHAWQALEASAVLAADSLAPAIQALPTGGQRPLRVLTLAGLPPGEPVDDYRADPSDATLMMLTSGSTGMSKGVVLSHRNLIARSVGSMRLNGFTRDEVTLNWMALDHVASLIYFHLRDVLLGCRQIHAGSEAILKDPLRWLDLIERFGVTVTFAPNFAFGLVNDAVEAAEGRRWDLSSLRFALDGGEAIVASTARRFLRLLQPHGLAPDALVPAWGMSETSSGVTYSDRFSLETTRDDDRYVEVGRPLPGFSMRIVDDRGEILPEGSIGHLQVSGITVTSGYYRAPEQNREAFTEDGWFVTGDLGLLRDGRLTITGREKDEIIINGVNYAGTEIESIVESLDGVERSYTAACAFLAPGDDTESLAIFFTPRVPESRWPPLLQDIRREVAARAGIVPARLVPLPADEIPKTAIGKIQRRQLKQRLEAGDFDAIERQVERMTGGAHTLPHWFFRKAWVPREAAAAADGRDHHALVWLDASGLGEAVGHALRGQCGSAAIIESAAVDRVERLDPDRFRIDTGDESQWRELLGVLRGEGRAVDRVVHCAGFGAPEADAEAEALGASRALLAWARAWSGLDAPGSLPEARLLVVASHSQAVESSDAVAPGRAACLGWLRTLERELPALQCRHLDLEPSDPVRLAHAVMEALETPRHAPEVALRGPRRLEAALAKIDLEASAPPELPLTQGGLYLLSGGLGGIGFEIARLLRESWDARLLLVGRTPLGAQQADAAGGRAARLRELQRDADAVLYACIDVGDAEAVAKAVAHAEDHFARPLDGVIHLAGTFHERASTEETPEGLAETFAPRLRGSRVLCDALERSGGGLFVGFGSLNGFFGGTGVGAYAAANAALAAFCAERGRAGKLRAVCLDWSMWDDVGISRGYAARDLSRARGYEILSVERGLQSFLVALGCGEPHVLIGLDAEHPQMRAFVDRGGCEPLEELRGFWVGETAPGEAPEVRDLFDHALPTRLDRLGALPLTASGEIDRAALAREAAGGVAGPRAEPRNDLERLIAAVWQEVLRLPELGVHDDFLALGGDSVRAAQVMNRLQERLGQVLHVTALFEAPSVAELADRLARDYPEAVAPLVGGAVREASATRRIDEGMLERLRSMVVPRVASASERRNPPAVFVVAPPRSGTTLLRVMLGGHPRLFAPPELYLLSYATLRQRSAAFSGSEGFWKEGTIRAVMELRGCDAPAAEALLDGLEEQDRSTHELYGLLQEWLGDRLLVDKSPTYCLDLAALQQAEAEFDGALYIHLLRHPLGMIRSFEEARIDQILPVHVPGLRGAKESLSVRQLGELVWLLGHRNARSFLRGVPADRQHALRFEDLVTRPRETTEALCAFLGLDLHPDMLEPYADRRGRMTDGVHEVSRMLGDVKFHQHGAIDAAVAERWRDASDPDALGDPTRALARELGYLDVPEPAGEAAHPSGPRGADAEGGGATTAGEATAARERSPARAGQQRRAAARDLLERLDELSEEEIDALLAEREALDG